MQLKSKFNINDENGHNIFTNYNKMSSKWFSRQPQSLSGLFLPQRNQDKGFHFYLIMKVCFSMLSFEKANLKVLMY